MNFKPAGYWFKQRGYTDPALDRRTATTTGQMLHQIVDPKPTPVILSDNLPPTPPPPSTYNNRLSEHDNRNIIQNYGEYFGRGFGRRLIPQSAHGSRDSILSHEPFTIQPDRSITQRDYRGLPALENQQLAASILTSTRQSSSGHWMRSCYDDWGQTNAHVPKRLVYHEEYKRMPLHPWQY